MINTTTTITPPLKIPKDITLESAIPSVIGGKQEGLFVSMELAPIVNNTVKQYWG